MTGISETPPSSTPAISNKQAFKSQEDEEAEQLGPLLSECLFNHSINYTTYYRNSMPVLYL